MYPPSKRRELGAALSAAFLAGSWTPEGLRTRGSSSLGVRPPWLRAVVSEVLAAYPRPPIDRARELAAYIDLCLAERRGSFPAPRVVRWLDFEPGMARARWPVLPIDSPAELAERLELDAGQLAWLADARGLERSAGDARLRNYRYRWQHRPHAPPRLIEQPKARLKQVQRWILREILDLIRRTTPRTASCAGARRARTRPCTPAGPSSRASTSRTSSPGCRPAGSTGYSGPPAIRKPWCTSSPACPPTSCRERSGRTSRLRARRRCCRHHRLGRRLAAPHLPQGAPTSPALASLASFGLDVRLSALAASLNLTYPRYADDLTFSGAPEVIDVLRAAVPDVVRSEGLRLNPGKTRIRSQASRQLVGGSIVNRRVSVPRDDYDRLKAVLHDATRHGPAAANRAGVEDYSAHVLGRIAWVEALNFERGRRLRERFDRIRW